MTNHEINIAIAEACGVAHEDKWGSIYKTPHGYVRDVPDYCNDLNAMHEAEKALGDRLELYRGFLRLIVTDDPTNRYNEPAFATARQRAEAYLRTIGKWEEDI